MKKTLVIICFLLSSLSVFATTGSSVCPNTLESIPILQGGRVKPLHVHAKETIKYLTGKSKFEKRSPTQTYCLLSFGTLDIKDKIDLKVRIEHVEVRKLLGVDSNNPLLSYSALTAKEGLIKSAAMRLKEENSYRKALNVIFGKIQTYKEIQRGGNWFIATAVDKAVKWKPVSEFFTQLKSREDVIAFHLTLNNSKNIFIADTGDHYLLELTYSKLHLAHWALLAVLLSLFAAVVFKKNHLTISFAILALVAQTAILVFRTMISERAPITNMYETVLFSGYGALVFALIFGHLRKEKLFLIVGLGYNVCTLFMISFANDMLPSAIGPLVPVLRDNFWLSTHVTTIILSYGALALSWILANVILIKMRFFSIGSKDQKYYADLIYACLKYGVVLLAAGIILGGVWADYSWGRFWGWDPKETWSLIVLCIYMAILHGKYTNWIPPKRFISLTAGAFMSVMMAWFGVNYILASGLHSYGFSQGGAIFLFSFFAVQILLIAVTAVGAKSAS